MFIVFLILASMCIISLITFAVSISISSFRAFSRYLMLSCMYSLFAFAALLILTGIVGILGLIFGF